MPYCALPEAPLQRLHAQTVGDWYDLYVASGDCPASVQANLGGVFRRFAQLVSGQDDLHAVELRQASGLWRRWQDDLVERQARGALRADSAARYKSWGYCAICWAVAHLARLDRHTDLSLLLALTPEMHAALRWLQQHRNKAEGQKVRQFFGWLDGQELGLEGLAEQGTALTKRFAEEVLVSSGVQTWRQSYSALNRGLRHLQKAQLVPSFVLHTLRAGYDAYALPWREIPQVEIRQRAEIYHRTACDEQAFAERTGPVVVEQTRDQRLDGLGRYMGFLVSVQGMDVAPLTMGAVFAREHLKAYLAFLQQRQGGRVTGGMQGTLNQLQQVAVSVLGLEVHHREGLVDPDRTVRFDRLIDPKRVARRSKAGRVSTLDEYHALIDGIAQVLRRPERLRTRTERTSLARLHAMLVLLGNCPLRVHSLRLLELHHLERDPLSARMTLVLPGALLKSKRPFSYPLSPECQDVLEHYLERHRPPLLRGNESTYLFPTRSGSPIAATAFGKQLALWDSQVRQVPLEQALSPHRIRDMVSRTCLTYLPEKGALVAATLLQHAGLKTLDQHYLDEGTRSAIQRNERLHRLVKKDVLGMEDVRMIVAEVRQEAGEWQRLVEALKA